MTVLPDWEIRERCKPRAFPLPLIKQYDEFMLQPSSYDVKLAPKILVPRIGSATPIDTREPATGDTATIDISDGGYLLTQGRFILAATKEWVNIHTDLVGRIEGKSSRARQGIQIHSAGYLDPGFHGNVTLEIVNFSTDPVILWPDVLIAQLSFEHLTDHCEQPYSSMRNHYQNSEGAVASRYGQ